MHSEIFFPAYYLSLVRKPGLLYSAKYMRIIGQNWSPYYIGADASNLIYFTEQSRMTTKLKFLQIMLLLTDISNK